MAETATVASGPHGAPAEHHPTNYVAVFIYLTLLTGAELGVYGLGLPRTVMIGSLVALALAKATLVAMYFMHLAMERKGLWIVAATPLVIVAFCYFMLRPDLSARSWASHDENMAIGHREEPATVLPPIPQGKALSNADQPAGSQVGQPNAAPMGKESPSGTAASPGTSSESQPPVATSPGGSNGSLAPSNGTQAPPAQ